MQEGPADAKETRMDAAVVKVLSEMDEFSF